jgi:hypothetical protein
VEDVDEEANIWGTKDLYIEPNNILHLFLQ